MKKFIPSIICFVLAAVVFLLLIGSSCSSTASASSVGTENFFDILFGTFDDIIDTVSTADGFTYMMKADDFIRQMQELYNQSYPFGAYEALPVSSARAIDCTDILAGHILTPAYGSYNPEPLCYVSDTHVIGFPYPATSSGGASLGFDVFSGRNIFSSPSYGAVYSDYPVFGFYQSSDTAYINCGSFMSVSDLYTYTSPTASTTVVSAQNRSTFRYLLVADADADIFEMPIPPAGSSDVYFTSNGGFQASKLVAKVGDDYVTFDGEPTTDPMQPESGGDDSSGGGLGGDVKVTGEIGVNGSVDVNVNVNTSDYLAPPEFDVTSYLTESPKSFIDYMENFFSFMPPALIGLLVSGVGAAIFMRLWGR
ncbi:MAG: hypothetical protein NC299_09765 [Lachnospiraceae bacterium]|nr:hypothetical protein [Ruminococcus sp.]MCM1275640.1 hypothetical protein [Lachnospiraceae bacterium]